MIFSLKLREHVLGQLSGSSRPGGFQPNQKMPKI
jgi:hypothetical protein